MQHRTTLLTIAALAMAAGEAAAQIFPFGPAPTQPTVAPQPTPPLIGTTELPEAPIRVSRTYTGNYSESHSRELFRSCDENRDDRLDLFETVDAFDILISLKDAEGFARFDTDRDGFVSWTEFDRRFRQTIGNGQTFRVRTLPTFREPEPAMQPLTPLQKFIRQFDADGDGTLAPDELLKLLERSGLPPSLGTMLQASDVDKSGTIDEAELAPWFQALPGAAVNLISGAQVTDTGMPPPWSGCDANGDGAIDGDEFQAMLRRLDPGLLAWARQLLGKLDRDGDGKLGPAEVAATAPTGSPNGGDQDGQAGKVPPMPRR